VELLDVTGRRLVAEAAGDLWLKSADGIAMAGGLVGSVALHWALLDGACCSVEPGEAGGLIWPVPTKVFADLLQLAVTLRLTERATQTALLEMCILTGRGHLADWLFSAYISVGLWGEPNIETAHNISCAITIVGYRGNSVYRVVASILVWVTCGRFPWKAPTLISFLKHCFQIACVFRVYVRGVLIFETLCGNLPWEPPTGYQITTEVTAMQSVSKQQPDKQNLRGKKQSQQYMNCCSQCLHLGPPQDINRDIREDACQSVSKTTRTS
jgi:hypothetical protein